MKKVKTLLLIITLPIIVWGQSKNLKAIDKNLSVIQDNIFRINLTQAILPNYETSTLSGVYERRIKNTLSIFGKIGIGSEFNEWGGVIDPHQASYHFYSAIEARYYFTLKRRQKREKPVLNFSCPYIGIEQNLFTNPIVLINQNRKDAFGGSTRTFLNLGSQKQLGKLYLGAFMGVSIFEKDLKYYSTGRKMERLHGGIQIGYVFSKRKAD